MTKKYIFLMMMRTNQKIQGCVFLLETEQIQIHSKKNSRTETDKYLFFGHK